MKNKAIIFICWLIKLPFRIIFFLVGVFLAFLTAFLFGIFGKKRDKHE